MKIGENSEDLSAGSICLSVDEAKPFQTVSIKLTVRADLQLSKDGLLFEHRVSKVNICSTYLHNQYICYC